MNGDIKKLLVIVFFVVFRPYMCTYALHGFAASPIAFISHERKQVVIQFLIKIK